MTAPGTDYSLGTISTIISNILLIHVSLMILLNATWSSWRSWSSWTGGGGYWGACEVSICDGNWRTRNVFTQDTEAYKPSLVGWWWYFDWRHPADDINLSKGNYGKVTKTDGNTFIKSVPAPVSYQPEIIYGKPEVLVTSSRPTTVLSTDTNLQDGFVPSTKYLDNAVTTSRPLEPIEPATQVSHVSRWNSSPGNN